MSKLLNIIFCCQENKTIKEEYIDENEEINENIADNILQINNDDKNNKKSNETCNTNNNINNKPDTQKITYRITLNNESNSSNKQNEIQSPPSQTQKEEKINIKTSNNNNIKEQNNKTNNFNNNNFLFNNSNIIKPKLILSGELFFNKQITLESNGLKCNSKQINNLSILNSPANNFVITTFGIETNNKSNRSASKTNLFINDFNLNFNLSQNNTENNMSNNDNTISNNGRIFEIRYNKKLNEYSLYFLHDLLILYYKLNNSNVYINYNKDYYFIIGDVVLTLLSKKINNKKEIIVYVEIENSKARKYSFSQSNTPIKIGRINSHIIINEPSISKIHGIIDFSKETSKFYYKDMGSTNGSTLLIKGDDDIPLHGEMNFKLEEVPFRIQEIV